MPGKSKGDYHPRKASFWGAAESPELERIAIDDNNEQFSSYHGGTACDSAAIAESSPAAARCPFC